MRSQGFTLIELMVTVVIGGLLLGGGIAAYRGIGERQLVKQAGAQLQSNLRLFQQKAMAGEKPTTGCIGQLMGYRVRKYSGQNYYWMKAECNSSSPSEKQIDLPENITFSSPDTFDIFFPVLKSVVEGAQTIKLTTTHYQYQVEVSASGIIQGKML